MHLICVPYAAMPKAIASNHRPSNAHCPCNTYADGRARQSPRLPWCACVGFFACSAIPCDRLFVCVAAHVLLRPPLQRLACVLFFGEQRAIRLIPSHDNGRFCLKAPLCVLFLRLRAWPLGVCFFVPVFYAHLPLALRADDAPEEA